MANRSVPSQTTLSRSEQREAYFEQWLVEHDYLRGSHIIDWLRHERSALKPDMSWTLIREWQEILGVIRSREVEILRRNADPFVFVLGATPNMSAAMFSLLSSLDPYKATIFRANGPATVVLTSNGQEPDSFVINEKRNGKECYFQSIHATQVFDILHATWARGGSKSSSARTFLCDAVGAEIDRIRKMAYYEFDQSVAVSSDGKGIILADNVIVFEEDVSRDVNVRLYKPATWQDAKLLLKDTFFDEETVHSDATLNEFLHEKMSSGHVYAWNVALRLIQRSAGQAVVRMNDGKTVFFTHRRYVPTSILPRPDELLE